MSYNLKSFFLNLKHATIKNLAAFVVTQEKFIEPNDVPLQIKNFKSFLRKDGSKYSTIVLNITHCAFQSKQLCHF